jgi:hypothetical protein
MPEVAEVAVPRVTRLPVFWSTVWIVIVCPGNTVYPTKDTGFEDSPAVRLAGTATHARRGRHAVRMNRGRTLIMAILLPSKVWAGSLELQVAFEDRWLVATPGSSATT